MARRLSDEQWQIIKNRYEIGDGVRAIARDFDIPHGTIQARVKKDNWIPILASQVTEIKEKINEISQVAKSGQKNLIEDRLKKHIEDQFAITEALSNLDKGAMNIHGMITKQTFDAVRSGNIKALDIVKEAANIVKSQGLDVHRIAIRAGVVKPAAVEINNNQQNNTQINTTDPVAASRAYQDFIKSSK